MKQICYFAVVFLVIVAAKAFPYEESTPDTDTETIEEIPEEDIEDYGLRITATAPEIIHSPEGSHPNRKRLIHHLLDLYNKWVNPDNVTVKLAVSLINLNAIDCKHVLESHIVLRQSWVDHRLTWDPLEFGGTELFRMSSNRVWKPDVTLYNSADPVNMLSCWDPDLIIDSTGKLVWTTPCAITSHCRLNLKEEPYGSNTCSFEFGSWAFGGYAVDLQFENDATMDLSQYRNAFGFEIVNNTAERKDMYFGCSKESCPNLTYNLTFRKTPGIELL